MCIPITNKSYWPIAIYVKSMTSIAISGQYKNSTVVQKSRILLHFKCILVVFIEDIFDWFSAYLDIRPLLCLTIVVLTCNKIRFMSLFVSMHYFILNLMSFMYTSTCPLTGGDIMMILLALCYICCIILKIFQR